MSADQTKELGTILQVSFVCTNYHFNSSWISIA